MDAVAVSTVATTPGLYAIITIAIQYTTLDYSHIRLQYRIDYHLDCIRSAPYELRENVGPGLGAHVPCMSGGTVLHSTAFVGVCSLALGRRARHRTSKNLNIGCG